MENNTAKNTDVGDQLSSAQSTSKDSFNMNNCKEALSVDEKDQDCQESRTQSDKEEFFDAEDRSDSEDEEEELDIDEEELMNRDKSLSDNELLKLKEEATNLKNEGNKFYKDGNHKDAIFLYTKALNICPVTYPNDRSILYANRAASRICIEMKDEALLDCNKALDLNPDYLRAVLRRALLHRKMDNLDRSLEDYKKVLELDKNNMEARQACATLPAEIAERNEKLKEEMLGKLKELGNICLKPFGLSTENFKMVKDPNTGGYSVNFQK